MSVRNTSGSVSERDIIATPVQIWIVLFDKCRSIEQSNQSVLIGYSVEDIDRGLVSGWKHCVHIILNWKTSLFISYTLMRFCLSRFLVFSHFIFTHASCFATFVFSVVKKMYWFPFTCTLIYNIAYSYSFYFFFFCLAFLLHCYSFNSFLSNFSDFVYPASRLLFMHFIETSGFIHLPLSKY